MGGDCGECWAAVYLRRVVMRCDVCSGGTDGYLSADERMEAQESSDGDLNGQDLDKVPVVDYDLLKAANEHCKLDPATTSYFNALLAAKSQAQPMIICRDNGVHLPTSICTVPSPLCPLKPDTCS
jgi:hypothetical protein